MEQITGGVTAAKGFAAASTAAGIKYKDRTDMAMIYSEVPCNVAGTFTKNIVKAAPVKWDQKVVYETKKAQAVVINAGIANACTGEEGMGYCKATAEEVEKQMQIPAEQVLVASTGVIGQELNIAAIEQGVPALVENLSAEGSDAAANAVMTTDTVKKEAALSVNIGGKTVTIGAIAKGSGMIHPNMGTMLCFITTDCAITHDVLQEALHEIVLRTFNRVTVDGDTSTNDMCVVLANGMAGNEQIEWKDDNYNLFYKALFEVCRRMARAIAADGEGASRLITCTVRSARSEDSAERLAKAVVGSSLVKAAMFGADANWGRVLCAMGYSKAPFRPEYVDIKFSSIFGEISVCEKGTGLDFDEELAKKILTQDEVVIDVSLNEGEHEATCWGCDLTYEYVKINGDYRT